MGERRVRQVDAEHQAQIRWKDAIITSRVEQHIERECRPSEGEGNRAHRIIAGNSAPKVTIGEGTRIER
jgi:hypothetical protein